MTSFPFIQPPLPMDPPPLPPDPPSIEENKTNIDALNSSRLTVTERNSSAIYQCSDQGQNASMHHVGNQSAQSSWGIYEYQQYDSREMNKNHGNNQSIQQECSYHSNLNNQKSYHISNFKSNEDFQTRSFNEKNCPYGNQSVGSIVPCSSKNNVTSTENGDAYKYSSPLAGLFKDIDKNISTGTGTRNSKLRPALPVHRRPPPCEVDPSLPDAIVAQLKHSSCDVCEIKLNSKLQAIAHYKGKPHAKKLSSAVEQYKLDNIISDTNDINTTEIAPLISRGTSEVLPPPAKKKKLSITDGSTLYCKCCDLSFTSSEHAKGHYLGRNHQRVIHGLKPLKAGYYNKDTGKWQRAPPDPRIPTEQLPTNEDDNSDPFSIKDKGKFFCELCGVSATSQDQFDGHLKGQRHKKNENKSVAASTGDSHFLKKNTSLESSVAACSQDSILESVITGDQTKRMKSRDLSINRTPSGNYYCSPCDLTLNSESQFAQHVESKKHSLHNASYVRRRTNKSLPV